MYVRRLPGSTVFTLGFLQKIPHVPLEDDCRKFSVGTMHVLGAGAGSVIPAVGLAERYLVWSCRNMKSQTIGNLVSQEGDMRDLYEVLRAKEMRIQKLVRELEALRLVAPLLTDDTDTGSLLTDAAAFQGESDDRSVRSKGRAGKGRPPVTRQRSETTAVTDEAEVGAARKISSRLKRLATPLLNAVSPAS